MLNDNVGTSLIDHVTVSWENLHVKCPYTAQEVYVHTETGKTKERNILLGVPLLIEWITSVVRLSWHRSIKSVHVTCVLQNTFSVSV